ncbi:SDR family NAD(P)-dependent oxidoreductase [Streptomyces akebiae]|uniref:SDR family NAD(P)-dependent oxidoreductase n=1 Tax=Streptomyces akebiae TaxID=2865673 RepID=UPI002175B4ED|nr:SDR family NAD(P)-dependent oxidoreductase [Streptomyces akebiae]
MAAAQVTSMGSGGGMATVGFYGAGKAALDSGSEALAMEVEGFGIKVTIVQMGGYDTGLFTIGTTTTYPLTQYQPLRTEMEAMWGDAVAPEPAATAPVIAELGRTAGPAPTADRRQPVLRSCLGDGPGPSGSVPVLGAPQPYRPGLTVSPRHDIRVPDANVLLA